MEKTEATKEVKQRKPGRQVECLTTLAKLDRSHGATGELESPWCAGENPGVSPRDFGQHACRMSGGLPLASASRVVTAGCGTGVSIYALD